MYLKKINEPAHNHAQYLCRCHLLIDQCKCADTETKEKIVFETCHHAHDQPTVMARLEAILDNMKVEECRKEDYEWLKRHLYKKNADHPDLNRALRYARDLQNFEALALEEAQRAGAAARHKKYRANKNKFH